MKKGFTLVELTISVALLSVVMIFLLNFLKQINEEDTGIDDVSYLILNKNVISETINKDIHNNGGIKSVSCSNSECNISLSTGNRTISLIDNVLTYTDTTNNLILLKREVNSNYSLKYNLKSTVYEILLEDYTNPENNIIFISRKS